MVLQCAAVAHRFTKVLKLSCGWMVHTVKWDERVGLLNHNAGGWVGILRDLVVHS
jgi:hypothetical protein